VGIAEVFSHHRAVLGLDQGVVVGPAGTRLGEFADAQLLQEGGDPLVDVLRTVVGKSRG
jgi:hypothetical protein